MFDDFQFYGKMVRFCSVICLVVCSLTLSFCSNDHQTGIFSSNEKNTWLANTKELVSRYPDSAITLIDAQIRAIDENKMKDTYFLNLLELKQSAFFNRKMMDSFLVTGEKIREVASRIPDSLAMAETLTKLYSGGIDFKHLKKAKPYIPGAIHTFSVANRKYDEGVVTALYGMVLTSEGDFAVAQQYLLKAYQIFEGLDSLKALGKVCTSIGNNYAGIGSMDESTVYYNKSLKIAEKRNDILDQVSTLSNLGINFRLSAPDTAMKIYKRALQLLPANSVKLGLKIKFNMANLYIDKLDYTRAEAIMKEILANCEETKYMEGVAMASNGLAGVYFIEKKYPAALETYKKAIEAFNGLGFYQSSLLSQAELIECYKALGDYKQALSTGEALQLRKDTMFSAEKQVAVHELEKKYQIEKKDIENKFLKVNVQTRNVALFILIFAVIALVVLLKKSNWLYKQRELAYSVLMDKYKAERRIQPIDNAMGAVADPSTLNTLHSQEHQEHTFLLHRLEKYFEQERPYLNPKLKVEDVAAFLNSTQRDITLAFKTKGNDNFNVFVNRFRVDEVRRLFEDPTTTNLKLETIAEQSGFGNRQSFYLAFEQVTGIKPGYYRKNILQQNAEKTA